MTIQELESERYLLSGGSINPRSNRNVKSTLLLRKDNVSYVSWSFDGKNYTVPQIVDNGAFKKCLAKNATEQYNNASTMRTYSKKISAYC